MRYLGLAAFVSRWFLITSVATTRMFYSLKSGSVSKAI